METDRACDAFKNMHLQKVQGIAVTDEHGNLTDALSVRDLRNIRPGSKTFSTLFETVKVSGIHGGHHPISTRCPDRGASSHS